MPNVDWRETAAGVELPRWLGIVEGPYQLKLNDQDTGFLLVVGTGTIGDTSDFFIFRDEHLQGIVANTPAGEWFSTARGRVEVTSDRDEALVNVIDMVRQSGGAI